MLQKEYNDVSYISGPLLFVNAASDLAYNAIVNIKDGSGRVRGGQVIEVSDEHAVIQVFEDTRGLDLATASVSLVEDVARLGVSKDMIGRRFDGLGRPIDGLPNVIADKRLSINGQAMNPASRAKPEEFIQTGITTIDINTSLIRGQKLPIFSGSGLPHNELAAQIARQAKVPGHEGDFAVVFAAMGLTQREVSFFTQEFERTGALARSVLFLNKADDPTVERILTPRMALTTAEYLAFEHGYHVLVILTDLTNYCEALREIGGAREEIPGRRGFPGYMYTDLASLYERAGVVQGKPGSRHPDSDSVDARRRHHPPDPRPDRLHHRGSDRGGPHAEQQGHLPADQPAAEPVALDGQRHRQGQDPRRPQERLGPAVCRLRQRPRPAQTRRHHR